MFRKFAVIISLVLAAAMLASCAQPTVPTAAPPVSAPAAVELPEKLSQAGKIVVGTSADYPPFEFLDAQGNKTGFDIELMTKLAERMGLKLEWADMPFDSLVAAVQQGKLDASISAFNYSEERDEQVDFTVPYYSSTDAFVVGKGFSGAITKPEDAAHYKIGVQSGTVQDGWLTSNLVETGLLPAENLSRYERAEQAFMDLATGRIVVVMADEVAVKAFMEQNPDLQIVFSAELSTGPMAIVVPEGDTVLKAAFDTLIKQLQSEGFVDELAEKYFK